MLKFLRKAAEKYYDGEPIISDEVFDALAEKYGFDELGAQVQTTKKAKHFRRMYSLKKIYEGEDKNPFEGIKEGGAVSSTKLDGAAISLLYHDGTLVRVLTRGDGIEGEDITEKFYVKDIVPTKISRKGIVQITGEIVVSKKFQNARNLASGSLALKDLEEFKNRPVDFIAYGVYPVIKDTFIEDMMELRNLGFNDVLASDYSEYPNDGVVLRINDNQQFEKMGYTSKHPRGAFAIKYRADVETKETKLLDVAWQVGTNGKVTPVAIFEPIVIDDANITRATLHNVGFVEDLDLHIGDTLLITRSGGIIPKVVGKL